MRPILYLATAAISLIIGWIAHSEVSSSKEERCNELARYMDITQPVEGMSYDTAYVRGQCYIRNVRKSKTWTPVQ